MNLPNISTLFSSAGLMMAVPWAFNRSEKKALAPDPSRRGCLSIVVARLNG
ncbi:MAG: hypothetical protein QOF56_126 [Acidobacteriaceae bacterium]|nr:hypothetical protein [Acidobacteriaceae bacterium]